MRLDTKHSASRPTRGAKSHWWRWNFSYADSKPLNQAGWTDEDWAAFTKKTDPRGELCNQTENAAKSNRN